MPTKNRTVIIAGNWKMYKTLPEALELINGIKRLVADVEAVEMVVCPPYTVLSDVHEMLIETNIGLGGQDLFWEKEGAFTGEVSAGMLKSIGCDYVIVGHSERRQYFGETNETVNKKVKAALAAGLKPIVCVGEKLEDRKAGKTFDVVRDHVENSLKGLTTDDMQKIVVAYEPVWAIGTGVNATKDEAQEVHKFIRGILAKMFGSEIANSVRIQYGGSVKPENIGELIAQDDVDGALVGGASLKADSFAAIITHCVK